MTGRRALEPGDVRGPHGQWRVLGATGRMREYASGRNGREYRVECTGCGDRTTMVPNDMHSRGCPCSRKRRGGRPSYRCTVCRSEGHNARNCPEREREDVAFDPDTRWEQDRETRVIVALWGQMTLEENGDLWDLSKERIRQIERDALRKLWSTCTRAGLRPEHVLGDGRKGDAWAETEQHAILASGPRAASDSEAA